MESIFFLGLSFYAWITIATVLVLFSLLLFTKLRVDVAFVGAIGFLLVTGVLDVKEALSGFSSSSVVVIGVLFVVVAGLTNTGVLQWIVRHLLGEPDSYAKAVARLMLPVAGLSSFLSNTAVVALFVNIVKMWSKKLGIAPSKLLIPLSYASGMGGVCTLIGTPPNLIISGLYADKTGTMMNVLATMVPGLFCLAIGVLSVIAMRRLLPDRQPSEDAFEATTEYTVELLVPSDNPHIGETVEEAGLSHVRGGQLIELIHFDDFISPASDDEPLLGGDRLVYAGQINEILELKRSHGLVAADHHIWNINEIDSRRKMRTAYVDFGSDLIDTKMTESDFEKENDVVLVAVARSGKRVEGQPREIQLQAGDTLLLECPPGNDRQLEQDNRRRITFFDSHFVPQTGPRTLVASIVLVMMFLLSSFHVMPLMATTMLAAGAMLLFRCCRMDRVVKYIEWDMLLILGSTVVFSTAIAKTGITDAVANGILDLCGTNPYVVMAVTCLLASVVTEFVSDVGSAAVFCPISWQQAQMLDCNPMPFVISLMLSVAISYASPIGSSTHILIYGPGSFRFTDFVRLGTIMHIVLLIVCLVLVNVIYPLYIY